MIPLSSNHLSVDSQLEDVVDSLATDQYDAFIAAFPEWENLTWDIHRSWVDYEASDVDLEYTSWCIDWIEANTRVMWDDGEPFLMEDSDYEGDEAE